MVVPGYDGAGNMAANLMGIGETYPKAMYVQYVHCAAHSLNLAMTN